VDHQALTDWETLSLPRRELESRLEGYARREGVGATERLLGVRVEPSLCFLDPELILHAYQRSELLAGQQVNQE
jgi:hypothetical protein